MPWEYSDTPQTDKPPAERISEVQGWNRTDEDAWELGALAFWVMVQVKGQSAGVSVTAYDLLPWHRIRGWQQLSKYTGICYAATPPNAKKIAKLGRVIIT